MDAAPIPWQLAVASHVSQPCEVLGCCLALGKCPPSSGHNVQWPLRCEDVVFQVRFHFLMLVGLKIVISLVINAYSLLRLPVCLQCDLPFSALIS